MLKTFLNLFNQVTHLPAGISHYQSPPEDPRNYRLHLRLEKDGSGVLIVNASTVLHLNQTAAEYAYLLVQNLPIKEVVQKITGRYRVGKEQALKDYQEFAERIDTLVTIPDLDPVTFLDFDRQTPYSGEISAPYRLDCALTYRLTPNADPSFAPTKRVTRELTTLEWEKILDQAWEAGIPHVIFTGGEPTLRDDLVELISHAEKNGQVSGLLTDGLKLAEAEYLDSLVRTGLDHIMIVLQPENPATWIALEKAFQADIFTAVHLTITPQNASKIPEIIHRLGQIKVSALSLSATDAKLKDQLKQAAEIASHLDMALTWDLPVPYSLLNPIAQELIEESLPAGAGRAWLYVEPDGDVLPAQGVNQLLGNFLLDPWEKIWENHP